MKRYWILLAVIALALVACGGGDESSDTTTESGSETTADAGTDTTADAGTDTTADAGTDTTAAAGSGLPEGPVEGEFRTDMIGPDGDPLFVPGDGTYEAVVARRFLDEETNAPTLILLIDVDGTEEDLAVLLPDGLIDPALDPEGQAVTLTVTDGVPSIEFVD